jgi:peptidoglycan hydrolase CwlO-like protein
MKLYLCIFVSILFLVGCQSADVKSTQGQQQTQINELDAQVKTMQGQITVLQKQIDELKIELGNVSQLVKKPPYVGGSVQEGN